MIRLLIALLALTGFSATAKGISARDWPEINKRDVNGDERLLSLLPDRFRLATAAQSQPIADQLTERIFEASSARRSFCVMGAESASDFETFLGVSKKSALRLKKKCAGVSVPAHSKRILNMMRSAIMNQTFQPRKVYAFAATASLPTIEGFTQKDGLTVIILNENEMNEAHMLRVLVHELAITFDQVGGVVGRFETESWEYGLDTIYPEGAYGDVFETPANLKELRCALRDPAVRYAAATERAIRFEDLIISELGLGKKSPALTSTASCKRTIGERAVQIADIGQAISWETDLGTYTECGPGVLRDANRKQTLVSRIRLVADTQLIRRSDGSVVPLCDLLIKPHVGARRPENIRHGGPRPRIGGW